MAELLLLICPHPSNNNLATKDKSTYIHGRFWICPGVCEIPVESKTKEGPYEKASPHPGASLINCEPGYGSRNSSIPLLLQSPLGLGSAPSSMRDPRGVMPARALGNGSSDFGLDCGPYSESRPDPSSLGHDLGALGGESTKVSSAVDSEMIL